MKIELIQVPYHLQYESKGMGAGPDRYIEGGAARVLEDAGHTVAVERIRLDRAAATAEEALVEIDSRLAARVRKAVAGEAYPVVLSGNCHTVLGTIAGVGQEKMGIIWFDAHGDYNTPDTTVSGFLDGMGLAIATGRCCEGLRNGAGLATPVEEAAVLLCGVRDLDSAEAALLATSAVQVVPADDLRRADLSAALLPRLQNLRSQVADIYLHIDVDVLDPQEAPANEYNTVAGGLSVDEVVAAIRLIAEHFRIRAAALTAFNPTVDANDLTLQAGLRFLATLADAISASRIRD